jgi:hypothetical protein
MRQKSTIALSLLSLLFVACEDGPNQTFMSAPATAGNLWNNGNPDASVNTGINSYDANFGSISAIQNCTADQKRVIWANMLQQPIALPLNFAGLNLAGETATEQARFAGLTLQEAESINCVGFNGGPGTIFWGDNGEVEFDYNTSNFRVADIGLSLGYNGAMTMHQRLTSRFGSHEYVFRLGVPILRDNSIYEINWSDISHHDLNEIFNAIMATFGAGLVPADTPDPDPNDCYADGSCLIVTPAQAPGNGGSCFMAFLPIEGFLFTTDCTTNTQPTISVPTSMFQEYYQSEPYSYEANSQLISAEGPYSTRRFNSLADPPTCFLQIGMDWTTFINNCILYAPPGTTLNTVVDDAGLTIREVNLAKTLFSPTHDNETIDFNIVGVNLDWADEAVIANPQAIVQDRQFPCAGPSLSYPSCGIADLTQARTVQWGTDIYDNGLPFNDTDNSGNYTGKGSSYIYREWMNLAQAQVNAELAKAFPVNAPLYIHAIGDPACFVDAVSANAIGCTGLEGIALQGSPEPSDGCGTASPAPICANYQAGGYFSQTFGGPGYGVSVLHSGTIYAIFCQNPLNVAVGTDPLNGNCRYNTSWVGALAQVVAVAGLSDANNLPGELADRRYYFKWYGEAEIKYMKAFDGLPSNQTHTTFADVAAQQIDLESIFYDTSGPFDFVEYIERTFMANHSVVYGAGNQVPTGMAGAVTVPANLNSVPMDFSIGVETLAGEQQFTSWYKFAYRYETAMFNAMLEDKATSTPAVPTAGLPCTLATEAAKCNTYNGAPFYGAVCQVQDPSTSAGVCTPLPGSQNNVNITNLAGNALLQGNYGSYECATQWPNVTIKIPSGGTISGTWSDVCSQACPNLQGVYPSCPRPPLAPPAPGALPCTTNTDCTVAGTGCNAFTGLCQSLALDLNGSDSANGLGGSTPRLAAYPAVWGQGAACNATNNTCMGGKCGATETPCGEDLDCVPILNPWAPANNPYSTSPCAGFANGVPVASGVGSVFAVGHKAKAAARLSFKSTNPSNLTAYLSIPSFLTPYNAITLPGQAPPLTPLLTTVPWSPSYDGVGFDIPVNATLDKNIQTQQLDFRGILATYLLDVVPWTDPITNAPDGTLTVDAIEGDDFLGEGFLCQDIGSYPVPGSEDLLGAHMYDSAASMLQWIADHPSSEINCGLIVRYTVYDNYVDYITSLTAGVRLSFSTGTSLGRVDAIVAFDPNLVGAP